MVANDSTDGQRSETPTGQDTTPKVVPPSKRVEDEEAQRKKRAQLHLDKSREALGRQPVTHGYDSAEDNGTSEHEPVDSESSSMGADEPVHFVAELATVSKHEAIDHPMPDAPPLDSVAVGESESPESDVEMEDAPPLEHPLPDVPELDSVGTSVPKDVEMEDAPPLEHPMPKGPDNEDVEMEEAPPLRPDEE